MPSDKRYGYSLELFVSTESWQAWHITSFLMPSDKRYGYSLELFVSTESWQARHITSFSVPSDKRYGYSIKTAQHCCYRVSPVNQALDFLLPPSTHLGWGPVVRRLNHRLYINELEVGIRPAHLLMRALGDGRHHTVSPTETTKIQFWVKSNIFHYKSHYIECTNTSHYIDHVLIDRKSAIETWLYFRNWAHPTQVYAVMKSRRLGVARGPKTLYEGVMIRLPV